MGAGWDTRTWGSFIKVISCPEEARARVGPAVRSTPVEGVECGVGGALGSGEGLGFGLGLSFLPCDTP